MGLEPTLLPTSATAPTVLDERGFNTLMYVCISSYSLWRSGIPGSLARWSLAKDPGGPDASPPLYLKQIPQLRIK